MTSVIIRNPETDPPVTEMVTSVFDSIPAHWKRVLPQVEVVVSMASFNKVPELREFCTEQNKQPGWKKSMWESVEAICPEFDEKEAMIWVYFFRGTSYATPEYYFKKHLYEVIAKLMWLASEELRREAGSEVPAGMVGGAAYMAFRDSFSRFFLNPDWLKERRTSAWQFMQRLDLVLQE